MSEGPRARTVTTLLVLVVALLVACGGAPPPPAPSPAAHPPTRELVLGTSGDYPPFSRWVGPQPEGYVPSLIAAFAPAPAPRWTRFRWPSVADDLGAGRFDVAADGMTVRPERSIEGRFTVPIAFGGAVLLARAPASLEELDRPGVRIGVNRGGHLERVARARFPAARVDAFAENHAVGEALARGEIAAAMTNTFEAPLWSTGLEGKVVVLGPLTHDVTALWVRADREDVADALDAFLLDEEESGRLAALRARWLGAGAGPRSATPVLALLAATAERLALMPYVAAAKKRAGIEVEDAAQEERVLAAAAVAVEREAAARGRRPPRPEAVRAFFRAQIEASKQVQATTSLPSSPAFTLDEQLRPAIARITRRMARLAVRVPTGTSAELAIAEGKGLLAPELLEPVARALVMLGAAP